jgi:F-box and WD-40 domain protein CDC4
MSLVFLPSSLYLTINNPHTQLEKNITLVLPVQSFNYLCGAPAHRQIHVTMESNCFGTHETLEALEFCFENNIILCRLPSHTSHKLQPCDVGVFAALKEAYRNEADRLFQGGANTVGKQHFTSLYSRAREKGFLAVLPTELSRNIVGYLDRKSLCHGAQVSRTWRKIINTDDLMWKRRFDIDGFVLGEGELERAGFDERDTSGLSAMRPDRESSISSNPTSQYGNFMEELAKIEGPYAASLYRRHYLIRKDWMGDIKPRHISICAHPRNKITCLQFDTEKILVGSDEDAYIDVYDIKSGALRRRLEGHKNGIWGLELHGNTLVSLSADHSLRVWDIEKGVCTQVFEGHHKVRCEMVKCLSILTPVRVRMPDGQAKMMPEVPLIITGCRDSNIRVWKLPLFGDKPSFLTGPSQNELECPYFVRALSGHHDVVRAIAAHADTLISGSYDHTVGVWKISTGEPLHRLQGHTQKVVSVVLDHKRNRCISGSMDNIVKVWCLETGAELLNLQGYTNLVGLLDFSHDRLVSVAADSTLRIWNPENGRCRSILYAGPRDVTCFQHDGQKVVVGSSRTVKMWNAQTGQFVKDLLTDLTAIWQVKFDDRRCVAAVRRDEFTYIEVSNLSKPAIMLN